MGGKADLMGKIAVADGGSPRAVGTRRLEDEAATRPQSGIASIQEAKRLILLQMFDNVQPRDQIECIGAGLQKVEDTAFDDARDDLPGQLHLLRTDVNPKQVRVTALFEKMQQVAATAGQVRDARFLLLGQVAPEIMCVRFSPTSGGLREKTCTGALVARGIPFINTRTIVSCLFGYS